MIFYDDFGNRAEIDFSMAPSYKGGAKEPHWRLSMYAEYDNDYLYKVSVYESEEEAMRELSSFSCGTFKPNKPEPKTDIRLYMDKYTGEIMTYDEMVEYCKENYDYGDETNYVTYMAEWWRECGFEQVER